MRLQILFHHIALYEEYSNCSTGFDNVVFGKKVMLSAFSSEASIILQRTLLVYLLTYVKYISTYGTAQFMESLGGEEYS